ncbi:MAG: ABC transporter permease subunit [Chloroflexi bacterium]|nr:ABC transporter permease subunit [Chloroflexota bacterium]
MSAILAVFKREFTLYFRSPIAYAVAFAMLLFLGILFNGNLSQSVAYNVSVAQQGGAGVTASDLNLAPALITFLMFLIGPLLTMRLLAEESREGTIEVLMTLPMNEAQFIIGKFLAVWSYYTVLLLLTVTYHLVLTLVGVPDAGVAFGAYLGAWLYGGAVLAVCMVWSAVTEDQIVAAFLSAATVLVLYLAEVAAVSLTSSPTLASAANFVRELGLQAHFGATLANGIIRAEDIAYFVLMMIGALFITTRIVETRRWRA